MLLVYAKHFPKIILENTQKRMSPKVFTNESIFSQDEIKVKLDETVLLFGKESPSAKCVRVNLYSIPKKLPDCA